MPKVEIEYRRTKTVIETGKVEIEVSDDAAETLRHGVNMDAWATFTMINEVKDWTAAPRSAEKVEYVARIDGVSVQKGS